MSPDIQLCHVFVFVEPGAPETASLEEAGLRESFRRKHPGQGTTNVCYCFDNAYLELLWEEDAAQIVGPAVERMRLAERARWRTTRASPFGIAIRAASPEQSMPFATWDYRPPYLPEGMTIPVALASEAPEQPLLFRSPGSHRPDEWADGRAGARQQLAGLAEIVAVHLDFSAGIKPSEELRRLTASGWLTIGEAPAEQARMILTLSQRDGGQPRRLSLPGFQWV